MLEATFQSGPGTGLLWLMGEAQKGSFLHSHWDCLPVHMRRQDPYFYESLLSAADAREIANTALRMSQTRLLRPLVETIRCERSAARDISQSCAELWTEFAAGSTILVQMAQRFHAPLARLCAAIEADLRAPVDATLICSPHGYRARLHFDSYDAVVLQLAGSKNWKLFDRARTSPIADLPPLPFETADAALLRLGRQRPDEREQAELGCSIRLETGDLLYVPRGVYHEVHAADSLSFHITLAVRPVTYLDLMSAALARHAEIDHALRKALPLPGEGYDTDKIEQAAHQIVERFAAGFQAAAALADINTAFESTRDK